MTDAKAEDNGMSSSRLTLSDGTRKRLIIKRERSGDVQPTVLAFTINALDQHVRHSVTIVKWTAVAAAKLKTLQAALGEQSPRIRIPTVSLRGRLELADQANLRLDRDLGMFYGGVILWTHAEASSCEKNINDVVLEWLVNDATDYALSDAAQKAVAQLKDLARTYKAVETSSRVTNPYEWDISSGKTTKPIHKTSYTDLADFVAGHLEGKAVFPELPGLRLVAGGQLEQNQAELMTEPIQVGQSRFSLVVRIRVFSYPGLQLPIITIHFSRRVWTSGLKATSTAKVLSGYAFPEGSSRALRFTLEKTKDEAGVWNYQPCPDFASLARRYFPGKIALDKLLKEGHRLPQCKLFVGLKYGAGERSEVKSGVPDLDKMDGFCGIADELAGSGLKPWEGLREIETSARPPKGEQHWTRRDSNSAVDRRKHETWLKEMQDSIQECYAGEHHLVIAVQPGHNIEPDAEFAERRLNEILGGSLVITRIPISSMVHGPRNDLPGRNLNNPSERASLRAAEWFQFIETVKAHMISSGRRIDGVLVIAREWYSQDLKKKHDDDVNQRAARITLAEGLGVPVQYLRPRVEFQPEAEQDALINKSRTQAQADIDRNFENRLMIAWLDLAYKSLGRVRPVKLLTEASKLYSSQDHLAAYPDHILALGVVRRNKRHFYSNESSILPYAIELDVESGVCFASFGYEDAQSRQMVSSDLVPLT